MDQCDGILVLGGGVLEDGALASWIRRRFDRALELDDRVPIVCLSAGTVHRPPPRNPEGFPIMESAAGAAYLLARNVPAHRIQIEASSYDTIGNAYFAKLLHVDPAGWRRLVIVTSDFHMPRTQKIFEWIFGMEKERYQLRFEATPSEGMPAALLERRREKEADAISGLDDVMREIGNPRLLHQWIYDSHAGYSALGWTNRQGSPALAEIY